MTHENRQPSRICIVDDSRLDRERLLDHLEGLGQVLVCDGAEAALEVLAREPVDLVLSDFVMPGMTGIDLLERIRRDHPGTDFILVTGDASLDSAIAALRMGATDYLQKPVEYEPLRRSVEQTLLRRRLYAENLRLRDSLRTIEACRALGPCLEPGEVYPVALDLTLAALGQQRGLALFSRESVPQGDGIAFRGFREGEARELRQMLVEEKRIDLAPYDQIEELQRGPIADALRESGLDFRSLVSMPVRAGEKEGGVVWVLEDVENADPDAMDRVRTVQQHAEVALENAARYSHAKERAFVDDVTGVYNARYLLSTADNEIRRADRYSNSLSVIFIDLDRFKKVNDSHGHLIGSQTLRNLSALLLECIREVDTLARYGGDEFTILLPDTPHESATQVAERIRRSVEAHVFECGNAPPLKLTISAGVASFPQHGRSRAELLDAADKAMYRAKSQGRNCIASAADLDLPPSPERS